MTAWLDAKGRFFNPEPKISVVPVGSGSSCVVIDDALAHPEALRDWAATQSFQLPQGYPYPGLVLPAPVDLAQRMTEQFGLHVRSRLGARRTVDATVRFSIVSLPPAALEPVQWLCHRDRFVNEMGHILFAASVLYLFNDRKLGGTSFYVPRGSAAQTERLLADSMALPAPEFSRRYGLQPGYIAGSNDYFERVSQVGAAWNRIIFYDGGLFHSGDVEDASLLSTDPLHGRLTLNGFFTCRRNAR